MNRVHSRTRRVCFAALLALAGATAAILLILILRLPDHYKGLKPGDILPDAGLISPEGNLVDTRSWRGRPTLLMLFDPACSACASELDNIDVLADALPDLRIALLSTRPEDRRESHARTYLDPSGVLISRMRRFAVPALYWIGPDGRIEYARSGVRSLPEDAAIFNRLLTGEGMGTVSSMEVPADGTGTPAN